MGGFWGGGGWVSGWWRMDVHYGIIETVSMTEGPAHTHTHTEERTATKITKKHAVLIISLPGEASAAGRRSF